MTHNNRHRRREKRMKVKALPCETKTQKKKGIDKRKEKTAQVGNKRKETGETSEEQLGREEKDTDGPINRHAGGPHLHCCADRLLGFPSRWWRSVAAEAFRRFHMQRMHIYDNLPDHKARCHETNLKKKHARTHQERGRAMSQSERCVCSQRNRTKERDTSCAYEGKKAERMGNRG